MKNFEYVCRKNKLKLTPQRRVIYVELMKNSHHPTTDAVYRQVKQIFPSISFDTVNRTLVTFAKIGLIHTVEASGYGRRYDSNINRHHHLKCINCGRIVDFYHSAFDRLKIPKHLLKEFKVINRKVVLSGLCGNCFKGKQVRTGKKRKRKI